MSLMKKNIIIVLAFLVVLIILTFILYVQVGKRIYAHRVSAYLTEEMNYSKDEIASVKGVYGIMLPTFFAVVRFRDEPEVEYTYFAHSGVIQFSYSITPEGLEKGITDKNLKHYVPLDPY